jgi:predicted O-methyltransferase YrrM
MGATGEAKNENSLEGLLELIKYHDLSNKTMVEIGCFIGVSTELFALHAKKLVGVDLWGLDESYDEVSPKSIKDEWKDIENIARARLDKYKNTKLIRDYSSNYAKSVTDLSIDLVYIDGSHTYNGVLLDLNSWYNKIKDGGVLSGHDYDQHTVKTAVNEFYVSKQMKDLKIFPDTSWAMIKPH